MNVLLNTPLFTVARHMAFDDACAALYSGGVWLRFYRWVPGKAVTFGYSQPVGLVKPAAAAKGFFDCVRRPTGGGMVFHEEDLTFSCLFESSLRPSAIYEKLHGAIQSALNTLAPVHAWGKTDPLAYAPAHNGAAGACFVNPVENDLLSADGHKILGGAIRRFERAVLYQGSLQLPGARQNPALKRAVIAGVENCFGVRLAARGAGAELLEKTFILERERYLTSAWNEKF